MLKNYLTIAYRKLKRERIYFGLNVLGLSVGLGAAFLLMLYAFNEFSYDNYHPKADRTYSILTQRLDNNTYNRQTPFPLSAIIEDELPDVEHVTQIYKHSTALILPNKDISKEYSFLYTDKEFFNLFEVPVLIGQQIENWDDPYQVYISEPLAERYFPDLNPVGQNVTIEVNNQNATLVIAGVFQALPANTHLDADVIAPMALAQNIFAVKEYMGFRLEPFDSWNRSSVMTYIQLAESADPQVVGAQLRQIALPHLRNPENIGYTLQSIQDIHLHSNQIINNNWQQGNLSQVIVSLSIAFIILIVAVFNFILLSMARNNLHLKEIGLRKVLGAHKKHIVRQILAESTFTAILALPIALLIAETMLPLLNGLVQKNLILFKWSNWGFLLGVLGITLLAGFFSGIYPALRYSHIQPYQTLKISGQIFSRKSSSRRALIIAQYVAFIGLLVCSGIIFQQFYYIQHKDLGYNKDSLITIPLSNELALNNYSVLKNELKTSPFISSISGASYVPPSGVLIFATFEGSDKGMEFVSIDYGFFKTMGISVVDGTVFSENRRSENGGIIITASAIPYLNLEEPIGKDLFNQGTIIGVVEDIYLRSLYHNNRPVMFKLAPNNISSAIVRIRSNMVPEALQDIETKWAEINPGVPFTFEFVDDALNQVYRSDIGFGQLIQVFTILAVIIAVLGHFALSMFMTQRRTTEIGVRKVVGASVTDIVVLLNLDYAKMVLIANVIAWPIAWYAMHRWLENFAYRIDMGVGVFILSGLLALLIALATVSWQTVRAATANPVDSLRYE